VDWWWKILATRFKSQTFGDGRFVGTLLIISLSTEFSVTGIKHPGGENIEF
jgi:hypothetical protein